MTDIKLEDFRREEKTETEDTLLRVTVSGTNPLPIGQHIFELTVVDEGGNVSQPAKARVVVADKTAPTAVLTIVDAEGRTLTENTLEFGASFGLSAKGSKDLPPGKITRYIWRLVE